MHTLFMKLMARIPALSNGLMQVTADRSGLLTKSLPLASHQFYLFHMLKFYTSIIALS